MNDAKLDALLKPVMITVALLVLGGAMTIYGFHSVDLHGQRDPAGVVTLTWTRVYFFRLIPVSQTLESVTGASLEPSRPSSTRASVIVHGADESLPLFASDGGPSEAVKTETLAAINDFCADPARPALDTTIPVRTSYGMIGFILVVFGIGSLPNITKALRSVREPEDGEREESAPPSAVPGPAEQPSRGALLVAALQTLLQVAFVLYIGVRIIYNDSQIIELHAQRDPAGVVTVSWTRTNLGLRPIHEELRGVTGASLETDPPDSGRTNVVVHGAGKSRPMLQTSTAYFSRAKVDTMRLINDFCADPGRTTLSEKKRFQGLGLYVGLYFCGLGVWLPIDLRRRIRRAVATQPAATPAAASQRPTPNAWLSGVLVPLLALSGTLFAGVGLTYTSSQTIELHGQRDPAGVVTLTWTRSHFFGLFRVHDELRDVTGASLESEQLGSESTNIMIHGPGESRPLLEDDTDHFAPAKAQTLALINDFCADPGRSTLSETVQFQNSRLWLGLVCCAAGLVLLVSMPGIVRATLAAKSGEQ